MGVDQTSLDRIRNATFPAARRGYDKHEVEKFLTRLADWLETGAGDESRSDVVKRELEKVGERTGAILAQAEESAQQIRAEAEEEARGTINTANMEATETRTTADQYATETRSSADAYAKQTRESADQDSTEIRSQAEQQARQTIESAEAQARRIVEEGSQRREDVEAVIADLVRRRDDVLADTDELTSKLTAAVTQHRPDQSADPFEKPEELDPLAREDLDLDLQDEEVDGEETPDEDAEGDEERQPADEPETGEEETTAEEPRRRGRGSRAKA
jgi:DivIVA domain-containing protein